MATVITPQMSVTEFEQVPGLAAGHELVHGEVQSTMPSNLIHGRIAIRLGRKLDEFVEAYQLGNVFGNDTGFRLDVDTLRGPDVAFVAAGRLSEPLGPGFGNVAPDLAVEIVSPNDTAEDLEDKVQTYLLAGVRRVWVIYPIRRTVHVYGPDVQARLLSGDRELDGEDVLPGFRLPLAELFQT